MFWREAIDPERPYQVPEDVFDLIFRLRGTDLDIDHAHALAQALRQHLSADLCSRIGVHGVRLPDSGNGWIRPQQIGASIPLSRRARLVIRVHRDDQAALAQISQQTLQLGAQAIEVGACTTRPLSTIGTLYARALRCERSQSEEEFLGQIAAALRAMGIDVDKMMCGKSGEIRAGGEILFTRALLVADLKPEEAITLQRNGIGADQLLGCGLFVPHKGIAPVYSAQE